MQRQVSDICRLRECAPVGALPPFQLRLSSLRSLSLRTLPPQGARGVWLGESHYVYSVACTCLIRSCSLGSAANLSYTGLAASTKPWRSMSLMIVAPPASTAARDLASRSSHSWRI